ELGVLREIGGQRFDGATMIVVKLLGERLEALSVARHDDQVISIPRQPARKCGADTRRRTGYQRVMPAFTRRGPLRHFGGPSVPAPPSKVRTLKSIRSAREWTITFDLTPDPPASTGSAVGIGIEIQMISLDPDTDSDPDPRRRTTLG